MKYGIDPKMDRSDVGQRKESESGLHHYYHFIRQLEARIISYYDFFHRNSAERTSNNARLALRAFGEMEYSK